MATGERVTDEAFVTLATTDAYAFGAMVLGRSLRRVGTTRQLAVMVTPGVSQGVRAQLSTIYDNVTQVDVLDSRDTMNLDLLTRPDLGVTFTKLHCWRLTQYKKGVFLDADTLVMQNVDDLFSREELSASPDAGWPDCFNSGVFVFKPSNETYQSILQYAIQYGSFDGGDQGLLNLYFSDWATKDINKHLPFVYNCVSQAFYSYLPAFKQFGANIKIVHFIGALKPWHHCYNTSNRTVETQGDVGHHQAYLQLWWDIFMADIKENLPEDLQCMFHIYDPEPAIAVEPPVPKEPPRDMSYATDPYTPPSVQTFYESIPEGSNSSNTEVPHDSDRNPRHHDHQSNESLRRDNSREYTHYEAFYSEPPMADRVDHIEPVHHFYGAKGFEVTWTEYNKEPVVAEEGSSNVQSNECDHSAIVEETNVDINVVEGSSFSSAIIDDGDNNNNTSKNTEETSCDESIGVGGHMASLRLEGVQRGSDSYTAAELADSGRQYSWEMGRIDYLGIDAFANIQKRLDEVLSSPPDPKSVDPVQPPVLQPPAPAVKQPVVTPKKPQGILKKH